MELKKQIIGNLLDLLKFGYEESHKLYEVGVKIESLGLLEEKTWDSIKLIVGMPEEQENVFASDYWYDFAYEYVEGGLSKEKAINEIVNWKESYKKLEQKEREEWVK